MIPVSFIGLCMHLAEGWEQMEIIENEVNLPEAECQICNKKYKFNKDKKKFEEIK